MKDEIIIYTGGFGSGKTELAINHSIKEAKSNLKVEIVDLDIVNPYFRSREMRKKLNELGIKVIAPPGKFAMADIPLISPEIKGAIQDTNRLLILDVGGDGVGAKALASFYTVLGKTNYQMNLVINPYRPFTRDSSQIQKMLNEIELASRLKINGLISNPNLGSETDIELIIEGNKIVEEVSEKINLPIRYLAIEKSIYKQMNKSQISIKKLFVIQKYMELPWDK